MTITNGYTTLANVKSLLEIPTATTEKDALLERGVEQASRLFDALTGRTYYARTETRYFDVPAGRELRVDDDLLTVTTLTNGDGTALTSAEYNLIPKNAAPHYAIRLKEASVYCWTIDSNGNGEMVISVEGTWGFCADADRPKDVDQAVEDMVVSAFRRRFGNNITEGSTITPSGMVITPSGLSKFAWTVINRYKKMR